MISFGIDTVDPTVSVCWERLSEWQPTKEVRDPSLCLPYTNSVQVRTHAARAERGDDFVRAEAGAWSEGHGSVSWGEPL